MNADGAQGSGPAAPRPASPPQDNGVPPDASAATAAIRDTLAFPHPLFLVSGDVFKAEGRLRPHEELLGEGKLISLDSARAVEAFKAGEIVEPHANHVSFFSHQWLGAAAPDPADAHFGAMVFAAEMISRCQGMPLARIWLWIDYASVPQAPKHAASRRAAIDSLASYASLAHCLMVIAPDVPHAETGETCNYATYRDRGWCRLECFAKICGSGLAHSFVVTGAPGEYHLGPLELETDNPDEMLTLMTPLDGTFTDVADAGKLKGTMLALYYRLLCHTYHKTHKLVDPEDVQPIVELVGEHAVEIFPPDREVVHFTPEELRTIEDRALVGQDLRARPTRQASVTMRRRASVSLRGALVDPGDLSGDDSNI